MLIPDSIQDKLDRRIAQNAMRKLSHYSGLIDFSSNDYLGFAGNERIFERSIDLLKKDCVRINGSTGSRLLTGHYPLLEKAENLIAHFHNAPSALIFNSGYDANVGLLSSVPQRKDLILYDEFSHASIREGIRLSNAKSFKIKHNDLQDLGQKLKKYFGQFSNIYVVLESVYSMDGDRPDLNSVVELIEKFEARLIVDEAHATGVIGENGEGMVQAENLQSKVFARLHTFGKALGCQGAAILGSESLRSYLINFCKPLIYSTAMAPFSVAAILAAYKTLQSSKLPHELHDRIGYFRSLISRMNINTFFIESTTPIQSCVLGNNQAVKELSDHLRMNGFDVRPILSPTVPEGSERLRICLHSFNEREEIEELISCLSTNIN